MIALIPLRTAETIEPTCLYFIWKDDFLRFLNRNVDICLKLARNLSEELYETHKEVRDVAFKESYMRLVELLLRLCQIHGEHIAGGPKLLLSIKTAT